YAPNARAMNLFGHGIEGEDWLAKLEARYAKVLTKLKHGVFDRILLVGDFALLDEDIDDAMAQALLKVEVSVAITPRGFISGEGPDDTQPLGAHQLCSVVLPGRTVNEKNGVFVNRQLRFQRLRTLLAPQFGSYPEWLLLGKIAKAAGSGIIPDTIADDRSMFRHMTKHYEPLRELTLARIGEWGLAWEQLKASAGSGEEQSAGAV
ncbi:MAG: molybdopterin-dependent oxidoreductase, partial [Bdellovibrionales bacterium]|nr:molybdopterin-dependent oxidoreductase [Bdellovibrionales bacterium]